MRTPAQAMARHFHFDLLPDSASALRERLQPHDPYPHGLACGWDDTSPGLGDELMPPLAIRDRVANAPITAAAGPESAGRV